MYVFAVNSPHLCNDVSQVNRQLALKARLLQIYAETCKREPREGIEEDSPDRSVLPVDVSSLPPFEFSERTQQTQETEFPDGDLEDEDLMMEEDIPTDGKRKPSLSNIFTGEIVQSAIMRILSMSDHGASIADLHHQLSSIGNAMVEESLERLVDDCAVYSKAGKYFCL